MSQLHTIIFYYFLKYDHKNLQYLLYNTHHFPDSLMSDSEWQHLHLVVNWRNKSSLMLSARKLPLNTTLHYGNIDLSRLDHGSRSFREFSVISLYFQVACCRVIHGLRTSKKQEHLLVAVKLFIASGSKAKNSEY